jgi:hypothetical protein
MSANTELLERMAEALGDLREQLVFVDFWGQLWKKEWWPGTELNRRHKDFQSSALPTELPGHFAADNFAATAEPPHTRILASAGPFGP